MLSSFRYGKMGQKNICLKTSVLLRKAFLPSFISLSLPRLGKGNEVACFGWVSPVPQFLIKTMHWFYSTILQHLNQRFFMQLQRKLTGQIMLWSPGHLWLAYLTVHITISPNTWWRWKNTSDKATRQQKTIAYYAYCPKCAKESGHNWYDSFCIGLISRYGFLLRRNVIWIRRIRTQAL